MQKNGEEVSLDLSTEEHFQRMAYLGFSSSKNIEQKAWAEEAEGTQPGSVLAFRERTQTPKAHST